MPCYIYALPSMNLQGVDSCDLFQVKQTHSVILSNIAITLVLMIVLLKIIVLIIFAKLLV